MKTYPPSVGTFHSGTPRPRVFTLPTSSAVLLSFLQHLVELLYFDAERVLKKNMSSIRKMVAVQPPLILR